MMWEVHKRTQQGVSAKLESSIYKVYMVHATISCLSHFLLKATMLYTYALMSFSRFFHPVLGLWCYIIWPVMWLQCHVPLDHLKQNQNQNKIKINIKSEKQKLLEFKASYNIRINIKELNRELCTRWSTLYTNYLWSMLYYFSLS